MLKRLIDISSFSRWNIITAILFLLFSADSAILQVKSQFVCKFHPQSLK